MPNLQKEHLLIFEIFNIKKCTLFFWNRVYLLLDNLLHIKRLYYPTIHLLVKTDSRIDKVDARVTFGSNKQHSTKRARMVIMHGVFGPGIGFCNYVNTNRHCYCIHTYRHEQEYELLLHEKEYELLLHEHEYLLLFHNHE